MDHFAAQIAHGVLEQCHAVGERFREALLLLLQHTLGVAAPARKLRIRGAHLLLEYRHELVEERWLNAKLVAVADGAADDSPEHIPAPFVQRQHTVNDQEGARADMIRDDPQ